ncbi:MAG: hypothetical protein K2J84_09070, partial [Bacteroidaceae bacterium]|nr:hypothetical protein [Bacteroidaceae bacterium]
LNTMLFLFIVIIIIAICCGFMSPKDKKQLAKNEECLAKLPDIFYKAHEMSSTEKALNLWPSNKDLLDIFQYTSENRCIYMKMKDGRSISCPLSELDVEFDKVARTSLYRIVVRNGKTKFSFYGFEYVFTKKQWDVIFSTLTLAGITRNASIMGKAYKNMEKAATILKIIKAIS